MIHWKIIKIRFTICWKNKNIWQDQLLRRWLNCDHSAFHCRTRDFRWNSRCASPFLVDSRIVNFGIANHAHEKWTFLSQSLIFLCISDLGDFIFLLFLKQFRSKICDDIPCVICGWKKILIFYGIQFEGFVRRTNILIRCILSYRTESYDIPEMKKIVTNSWNCSKTHFSFTEAGTIWSFPDPFIIDSSFSLSLSVPFNRKHTKPILTSLQSSNRLSLSSRLSNRLASLMWLRM